MGILRTDRVSGLGGANAIKGSVLFSEKQYFKIDNHEDFQFGTGDWTIEYWWNATSGTGTNNNNYNSVINTLVYSGEVGTWRVGHTFAGNNRIYFATGTGSGFTDVTFDVNVNDGEWHHIAFVRSSNTIIPFVDGVDRTADKTSGSTSDSSSHSTTNPVVIGYNYRDDDYIHGHLSNLRVTKGTAVYTSNFTPPTGELQKLSGTSLLCFQSPGNILKEETGKILQPYRDGSSAEDQAGSNSTYAVATRFTPNSPVGFSTTTDVGTQFGTTFDGVTTFDSQAYFVPPGGNTRERNRGRGLFGGGYTTVPGSVALNTIYYVEIQSMGNSVDFGDLNKAACWGGSMCASSTRGLHAGGTTPTNLDSIDFVTIANTGNATDFGNLTTGRGYTSAASNQTRGLIAGGRGGSPVAPLDSIDLVTIATAGDATDFGDLSNVRYGPGALASPTRALIIGGSNSPATPSVYYASIDRVEIATAGDASDFGDLTAGARYHMGCASSTTRGLIGGGTIQPARVNSIEFVTIASDGNSSDFGDLLDDREHPGATSNGTRAIWAGGVSPYRNSIEFVTIATTGNAQDFGDITDQSSYAYASGTSDSHGGLS